MQWNLEGIIVAKGHVQPDENQSHSPRSQFEMSLVCLSVWHNPLFPEIGDDKSICNHVNPFLHFDRQALSYLR